MLSKYQVLGVRCLLFKKGIKKCDSIHFKENYVTRSFINSFIKYYFRSFDNILKALILFEIKISNNKLNIIQINSLDIRLTFRVYI